MRRMYRLACLAALVTVACSGSKGDQGPMGPAGPPGDTVRGVSHVAHFDRDSDLDTWEYTTVGQWRVEGGELIVSGGSAEAAIVGPSTDFEGDLDVSVVVRPLGGAGAYGLRFHASVTQAYWLEIADGAVNLWRESDGEQTSVIPATAAPALATGNAAELRVVVRDRTISVYVDGTLTGRGEDLGPRQGRVQVFVRGAGEVAFDDLWVHTALPLL